MRSLLIAPANRVELARKFPRYAAGAYVLDLEDGTPLAEKENARALLAGLVAELRASRLTGRLYVRVNDLRSPLAAADIAALAGLAIDGVVVPKVGAAADLTALRSALMAGAGGRDLGLVALVESMQGVASCFEIAAAPGIVAMGFGAEDYITDIGGRRSAAGLEVLHARSQVVLAAKLAGVVALDQVVIDIRDEAQFLADAEVGCNLGYDGKMCLTPRQVELANQAFAPSPGEIARARRLVAAYERAKAAGIGAIDFEGQMVDEPLLRRAQRLLDSAAQGER